MYVTLFGFLKVLYKCGSLLYCLLHLWFYPRFPHWWYVDKPHIHPLLPAGHLGHGRLTGTSLLPQLKGYTLPFSQSQILIWSWYVCWGFSCYVQSWHCVCFGSCWDVWLAERLSMAQISAHLWNVILHNTKNSRWLKRAESHLSIKRSSNILSDCWSPPLPFSGFSFAPSKRPSYTTRVCPTTSYIGREPSLVSPVLEAGLVVTRKSAFSLSVPWLWYSLSLEVCQAPANFPEEPNVGIL